jgi:hypothetical protein
LGFSVLRADGEYSDLYRWQLDACTAPVRNSKNPTWSTPIKLWIPHGAAASLHAASKIYQDPDLYPTYHNQTSFWEKVRRRLTTSEQALLEQPVVDVLVRLFDRDIESEADEELATATLQLGADRTGTVAQAPMGGLGKFASQPASTLSFCWELVPYLPPPAAILTLRAIEILNFVPRVKPKPAYEQRGYAASTASSKVLATTRRGSPVHMCASRCSRWARTWCRWCRRRRSRRRLGSSSSFQRARAGPLCSKSNCSTVTNLGL